MARKHKARFGSISTGTLREQDLIPAFADELKRLRGALPRDLANAIRAWGADLNDAIGIVESLTYALNEYAPPYGYFGTHPGDGSDFGFWIDMDSVSECFDGLRVKDTSEVPRTYRGEVLHVNDHGNATLYVSNGRGKLREIWGIV